MGDSTENTNELDSYGVWVKRPPQDSDEDTIFPETEVPAESNDAALTDDGSFDIPDFGEIPSEDSVSDETGGPEEISIENPEDFPGESEEESEMSLDDFLDDSGSSGSSGDGEISLDDFMGDSSGDGEISLDDFLDGDSFGSGESKSQKEDDVGNDEALDINLDFDPPQNEVVPTEEIIEETDYDAEDDFESDAEEAVSESTSENASVEVGPMEEVSLDDFSLDESDAATADAAAAAVAGAAENGEGNPEEGSSGSFASPKKTVIDYDLAITEDDEISSSPSIKEIKTDANAEEKETSTETTAVNNELLERIISDLSGLKSEISTLKNDLAILKDRESFEKEPGFPVDKEGSGVVSEAAEEEPSGFFNNSDEDETIALSGDELTNIMNSADFTEEVVESAGISAEPEPEIVENEETEIPEYISDDEIVSDSAGEESPENTAEETSEGPEDTIAEEPFPDMPETFDAEPELEASPAEETVPPETDSPETDSFETDSLEEVPFEIIQETASEEPAPDEISSGGTDGMFGDETEPSLAEDSLPEEMFSETPSPEENAGEENLEPSSDFSSLNENESLDGPLDVQTEDFSQEIPETISENISEEPSLQDSSESSSSEDFTESFTEPSDEPSIQEEPPLSDDDSGETEELSSSGFESFESAEDSLPEEIDIPKVDDVAFSEETENADDIMVASSNSDFMDSVTTDEPDLSEEPITEEPSVPVSDDEISADETLSSGDLPAENAETEASELEVFDEPEIIENEEPFVSGEEPLDFEPKPASDLFKEEIMEEPPKLEEAITDENIDYLKEDSEKLDDSSDSSGETEISSESDKGDLPEDIKADVKSVLLYMDQLLENLPEEKIMEFAKSEQFATYKKLFNELGLS